MPGMSWGSLAPSIPLNEKTQKGVEVQVCRSSVCQMMGFFKISRISKSRVFKISRNPMLRVECCSPSKPGLQHPQTQPHAMSHCSISAGTSLATTTTSNSEKGKVLKATNSWG